MKKPRLILHIGTHKTGTTGIQRFCAANCEVLLREGIYYPSYALIGEKEHYGHHRIAHGLSGNDPDWPTAKVARFLKEVAAQCPEDGLVLVSAEPFYRHLIIEGKRKAAYLSDRDYWQVRKRFIEVVAAAFEDFEVELVAVFRKQPAYFDSLYQEIIKVTHFTGTPFEYYLMKRNELNYFGQMRTWAELFPNIRVLLFEELLKQKNLVRDFLNAATGKTLALPEVASTWNSSLHPLVIETKRRFNALPPGIAHAKPSTAIVKALENVQKYGLSKGLISDAPRFTYLTPSEARLVGASCRTSNLLLRRRFFPDGSLELEQPPQEAIRIDSGDARYGKAIKLLLAKLQQILSR